jgi:DNA-binding transcriptional MerR regulator
MGQSFRIREFAQLAGVTVRALHHYDRLGLLKPQRTGTGYRAYFDKDLETLEQIVALRFIGLPLNKIKTLLRRSPRELATALRAQRTILDQKKHLLEQAINAIGEAEMALMNGDSIETGVFRHIIEVIQMQNKSEEWKQQYRALVQQKLERLKTMTADDQAKLREEFVALFKRVDGAIDEDPAGPRGQELASRYVELLRAFTTKEELSLQLQKVVATFLAVGEWPAGAPPAEPPFGGKAVWEFMARALAARQLASE